MLSKKIGLLVLLLFSKGLFAQTEHQFLDTKTALFLNVEKYTPNSNFLFLASRLYFFEKIEQEHFFGYDLRLNDHWAIGGGIKGVFWTTNSLWKPALWLSHSGNIRKIEFLKQVLLERQNEVGFQKQTNLIFKVSLAYQPKNWRFVLASQFAQFYSDIPRTRTFDRSQIRVEIARYFPKFSLSFFYEHQTDYYLALAQYNQQNQLIKPDRNLNFHQGFFGIRCHYLAKPTEISQKIRYLDY